jgi:hypothetical protein
MKSAQCLTRQSEMILIHWQRFCFQFLEHENDIAALDLKATDGRVQVIASQIRQTLAVTIFVQG